MRKYTDEDLTTAVEESSSIREVFTRLGVAPAGGNYFTFHKHVERLGLDTSHFLGQGWNKGQKFNRNAIDLLDLLKVNTITNSNRLRKRLISAGLKSHKCEECENSEWLGKPIPLELEHINGDNTDNRLENLKVLCPNCHALTPTYRGRNIKNKKL